MGETGNDPLYRWRFGFVEFDETRHELRVSGLAVEVEHKPLEVLSLLLRHAGEVVTKEELFEQAWAGRVTVDHVLATAVGKLRKALGGEGEGRIVTVPRIGYRFDGPVERMAAGRQVASELQLEPGQPVPGRGRFVLERPLGRTLGNEVWLARHPRSRELRVFKFSLGGERLPALKREATLARVLRETLGERSDFVRVLDWNFESPPFYLECEYGGQALPEWAAEEGRLSGLDRGQRIALFLQIAGAVAAAHAVGVLHKDLKPANILMAPREGAGWQARLTDFGSSRLLQPERLAELGITGLGFTVTQLPDSTSGTPLYLAPELIAGQPPTVRSDLYALGVLLYQWLAGDLRRTMAPGWERDIDDPLLAEDIARATDGDPAQRLGSVAELVERLSRLEQRRSERERQIASEAASAAMRQALDRTRARRPWIAATIAVLGAGLLASGLLWWRSETQRGIARQQAARAEAVVQFLSNDLIGAVSPGGTGFERNPTIKDMLEYASANTDARFAGDPAIRGSLHAALGQSWRTLGQGERGVAELRAAVADYGKAFGESHEQTLRTRYALVRSLMYASRDTDFGMAEKLLDETDALAAGRLRADSELALDAAIARGVVHSQRMQSGPALASWRRADVLQRELFPDDAQRAILIRDNLAASLLGQGKKEQAVAMLRSMLADPLLDEQRIGESRIASLRMTLARALRDLERYGEALPLAQSAAVTSEKIFGADHYQTLVQLSTVASIYDASGDCLAALPVQRTVRNRMAARYGADKQATLVETGNLGSMEFDCGDRSTGLALLRQAESTLRAKFGEDNAAANAFRAILAEKLTPPRR